MSSRRWVSFIGWQRHSTGRAEHVINTYYGRVSVSPRLDAARRRIVYHQDPHVKILLDEQQLRDGVHRMATDVTAHYGDRPVTIIGALNGCIVLLADLIRQLKMPLRVGLARASSYRGATTTRGAVTIDLDMLPDVRGRDVLLIDDIFDTGHTLVELLKQIGDLGPTSVRTAVLLRKLGRQQVDIVPDFFAFEIPDTFVVGYGLDYNDLYRNLPYIAVLQSHETAEGSPA